MIIVLLMLCIEQSVSCLDFDCDELVKKLSKQRPMHIVIYQGGIEQTFSVEKPTQIEKIEIKEKKSNPEIIEKKLDDIEKLVIANKQTSPLPLPSPSILPILLTYIKPISIGFIIGYYNIFIKDGLVTSISLIKYVVKKIYAICTGEKSS